MRVTAARANIRAEPSEKAPVLTQVIRDTRLQLQATEGDWFKVRVILGAVRFEGYISKKVAALMAPAKEAAPDPAAAGPLGISVAHAPSAGVVMPLRAASAMVRVYPSSKGPLGAVLETAPLSAGTSPAPNTEVTYVWLVEGEPVVLAGGDRRPAFVIELPAAAAELGGGLVGQIVRLAPASSGARAVAAARGRADLAARGDADWDFSRALIQSTVASSSQSTAPGTIRLQPDTDLEPGDYGIVVRPAARLLSGTRVFGDGPEGKAISAVWPFRPF